WLRSAVGRRYLDCILHNNRRRTFSELRALRYPPASNVGCQHPQTPTRNPPPGILESPALPPGSGALTIPYKLFVSGKSGVGKTALVAMLAGVCILPTHYETRGTEVTTVFWPAKPVTSIVPVMFQLNFWD
ncbi:CPLN2 protein, partial [Semnornis frantzii]|nr:CPLN2 protein [Semnornis frantzii]